MAIQQVVIGISDLCRMAIIYFVIIHYKSCKLILTEDFFKKVTIRCEIIVDLCLMVQTSQIGQKFKLCSLPLAGNQQAKPWGEKSTEGRANHYLHKLSRHQTSNPIYSAPGGAGTKRTLISSVRPVKRPF